MSEQLSGKRADAQRNRQSLLRAAGSLIVERGTDFPLKDVADRAGVGVGTLYRNFRDRDELFDALAAEAAGKLTALGRTAAAEPSGWQGIRAYLDGCVQIYEELPWMLTLRSEFRHMRLPDEVDVTVGEQIISRAQREGTLRSDVGIVDVALAGTMLAGLSFLPEAVRDVMIPRLRDIVLDGLRPARSAGTDAPAAGLTADELTDIARVHVGGLGDGPRSR